MYDQTLELAQELRQLKHSHAPQHEITACLRKLGETAMHEENIYKAVEAFIELGDKQGLKQAADLGFQIEYGIDSLRAYELLEDEQGIKKHVQRASVERDKYTLRHALEYKGLSEKISQGFSEFRESKGYDESASFPVEETFNAAFQLARQYDYGIGIAKGGLYSAHAFSVFDLPVILAEAHRKGRGATFKWFDSPECIEGKDVIVFDKDAVTGKTLRRTIRELQEYSPNQVDIYFNHSANKNPISIRSLIENISQEFVNVWYPANLTYDNFYEAFMQLREKFDCI